MLRVASNALIVPPFECAWLSLHDYQLDGSCCLQFDCKGESDVTIILKPFPGAKRWQHLQRLQGPAGEEQLAVEANYTVILGSHRNSKLKIEKNGEEQATATGLPGCTVHPATFTSCWINYSRGSIAIGTGPVGSSLSFIWHDADPAIPDIQHIGLSCWDTHVSYRNVQLLAPLEPARLHALHQQLQEQLAAQQQQLQRLHAQQQQQQLDQPLEQRDGNQSIAASPADQLKMQLSAAVVPPLLQLVQEAITAHLQPASVCHVLQLSEALLPRTLCLYEAAVQLAGEWFEQLVRQHLQDVAGLPADVLIDVLHEPLLDVSELHVFEAVAAWCMAGSNEGQAWVQRDGAASATHMPHCEAQDLLSTQLTEHQTHASDLQIQQQHWQRANQEAHSRQEQHEGPPTLQQAHGLQQQQRHPHQLDSTASGSRTSAEVLELLQLVRFALMSSQERQAVLAHAFTQQCPLVQHCLQADLQRLQEYSAGRTSPATEGTFHCQQRRLVLPTAAGPVKVPASSCAAASTAGNVSEQQTYQGPLDSSRDDQSSIQGVPHSNLSFGAASGSDIAAGQMGRTCSGWLAGSSSSSGGSSMQSSRYRHRRRLATSCKELMYVCDGDKNGVIYYLATEYGTQPWVNPVLSKAVDIKASSPPSRYTDAKALVSGQFLNTSFAGPRYLRVSADVSTTAATAAAAAPATSGTAVVPRPRASSPTPCTWWQLDLGPQHRLLCNYYVIRHDGSHEGFVRSWALQGSNDLQHWLDLRRHSADSTVRLPGQYGRWPVTGPAASMPYRAFRLLLLGPTQSPTNPWAFCLSYWELYGYFYKLRSSSSNTPATVEQPPPPPQQLPQQPPQPPPQQPPHQPQ